MTDPRISQPNRGNPKFPVDWFIRNLDTGEDIRPQFPMPEDGVSFGQGGNIVSVPRFGEETPVLHWTHGRQRTFTFSALLYVRDKDERDAVKSLFLQIQRLTERDPDKKRPPICVFKYGDAISETVLVASIDPNIRSIDSIFFHAREIRLSMVLERYRPFSQLQADPTKPPKESFLLVASNAERSYEAIAKRRYGDPLLGDRIRKRHPQSPHVPLIGETVRLPPQSTILKEEVVPAFHALSLTDTDAVDNFERILEARSARQIIEVR
ncbi:hypothetical protein LCGC14_0320560 [marine sediment metagenome]|uniref:Uncharacterized protein n=1 Tax=marine sediment metagenome TaxID=412755 RepID=A0A0F9WRQ7_9ZZZZ